MNSNTPILCAVAGILIHVVVRLTNGKIPNAWRPWLGVAIGQALAAVDVIARGTPVKEAMGAGAVATFAAISAHELGAKKIKRVPGAPIPPAIPLAAFAIFFLGCQGITSKMAAAGGRFMVQADPILLAAYTAEQTACLSRPVDERQICVNGVRLKWTPLRKSLNDLRVEWCAVEPTKCTEGK